MNCVYGKCDACGFEGYFGWCVTNKQEHFHACKRKEEDCRVKLEKRLGTFK